MQHVIIQKIKRGMCFSILSIYLSIFFLLHSIKAMEVQINEPGSCFYLFKGEIIKSNTTKANWDNVNDINSINYAKMEDVLSYLKSKTDDDIEVFLINVIYKNAYTKDDFVQLFKDMHAHWSKKENVTYANKLKQCINRIELIAGQATKDKNMVYLKNDNKKWFVKYIIFGGVILFLCLYLKNRFM